MEDNRSYYQLLLISLLFFIAVNLFILDLKVFSPQSNIRLSDIQTMISPSPAQFGYPQDKDPACPQSCQLLINTATQSAQAIGSPQQTVSALEVPVNNNNIREFYVPLGTGSTSKNSWDDLYGTETVIDTANYGSIKEAYFIASLKNPNQIGQVEVQLFNVTDKHPVWFSTLKMNGPVNLTLTSDNITLDSGNKLYRVQMLSTLSAPVSLENAKIKIITQ